MRGGILARFDRWLGETLFAPVIIRICQAAGCTQHAFHRWARVAACLAGVAGASSGAKVLFAISGAINLVTAAIVPATTPAWPMRWFRLLLAGLAVFFAVTGIAKPHALALLPSIILMMFAEYAATITDIPPADESEPMREPAQAKAAGK
jgi:hypothetical protein